MKYRIRAVESDKNLSWNILGPARITCGRRKNRMEGKVADIEIFGGSDLRRRPAAWITKSAKGLVCITEFRRRVAFHHLRRIFFVRFSVW